MYQRMLMPVDGSACSKAALREVVKLAAVGPREICLLHVVEMAHWHDSFRPGEVGALIIESVRRSGMTVLEEASAFLASKGVRAESSLLEAADKRASEVIVQHALEWRAELVVMGTHGRRGLPRLVLGSDAAEVVRASPVPVLLVRDYSNVSSPEKPSDLR
jgi:nucleotide-binding universal stress UspA family protein